MLLLLDWAVFCAKMFLVKLYKSSLNSETGATKNSFSSRTKLWDMFCVAIIIFENFCVSLNYHCITRADLKVHMTVLFWTVLFRFYGSQNQGSGPPFPLWELVIKPPRELQLTAFSSGFLNYVFLLETWEFLFFLMKRNHFLPTVFSQKHLAYVQFYLSFSCAWYFMLLNTSQNIYGPVLSRFSLYSRHENNKLKYF